MLRKRLILVAAVLVIASIISFTIPMLHSNDPVGNPSYPAWLTSTSNEISVSQLATAYSAHNLTLKLPAWLPTGQNLTSVHVPNPAGPYGLAVVTYSAHGTTDFRYAEIVLQIIPGGQPSSNDLTSAMGNSNGAFQQLTVAGMPVLLNPNAPTGDPALQAQFGSMPYAMFWSGGIYYQIGAYHPLTAADVVNIIASMQQVH